MSAVRIRPAPDGSGRLRTKLCALREGSLLSQERAARAPGRAAEPSYTQMDQRMGCDGWGSGDVRGR